MSPEKIRLQKYIAECGISSRRKAETLITEGRVKVNGQRAQIGAQVIAGVDTVTLNGKRIKPETVLRYIMLNKPRGYVTTLSDEFGRKCVTDLLGESGQRLFPVGRLDKDSEGLLLLTNDGAFSYALTHPSESVPKVYRVTVKPEITDSQFASLQSGLEIDGRQTQAAEIQILSSQPGRAVLLVTLTEGRNRQIRKMCEAVNLEVARLKRVSINGIKLGMLPAGKWRDLTADEVDKLKKTASGGRKTAENKNPERRK